MAGACCYLMAPRYSVLRSSRNPTQMPAQPCLATRRPLSNHLFPGPPCLTRPTNQSCRSHETCATGSSRSPPHTTPDPSLLVGFPRRVPCAVHPWADQPRLGRLLRCRMVDYTGSIPRALHMLTYNSPLGESPQSIRIPDCCIVIRRC